MQNKKELFMKDYVIFTDSACDIKPEVLKEWGVYYQPLNLRFNGEEKEYVDGTIEIKEFYDRMRAGGVAKTAAVNTEDFSMAFEEFLKEGKDILYLGFSSGLSTTFNSARLAAAALSEAYPKNKIIVIDTLAASAGEGLIVYLAKEKKNEGKKIEAVAAYVEEIKMNVAHWFTVDDLVYLKRGGRVSPLTAMVGNLVGIKPVLHVDNEGHLIKKTTARGRKASILELAKKYGETALDTKGGTVFISNADCMADVEFLSRQLEEKYGVKVAHVTDVGAVIGSHSPNP